MTDRGHGGAAGRDDRGFVLVTVLVLGVVIAGLAARTLDSGRASTQVAHGEIETARARAASEGGIAHALHRALQSDHGVIAHGEDSVRIGDLDVRVTIGDEAAKIDLNAAPEALLHALMIAAGEPPADAAVWAQRIADWRDIDDRPRPQGAERTAYSHAGWPMAPKNRGFSTPSELGQVLGMRPALVERLLPALTVHSGLAMPAGTTAQPLVTRALDLLGSSAAPPFRDVAENADSRLRLYAIRAETETGSGGRAILDVVARIDPTSDDPLTLVSWRWANH